jgi:hypothetical protein
MQSSKCEQDHFYVQAVEISKGSDHTKKRLFEPGTDNNAALDSEIFSECCGEFPEAIFQRQRAFKRPRADLSELSPEAGGIVMVQGFVQSASKKGKKLALVVLRDGPRTLKCVISADTVGATDYMVSFAGKLERESYVEVHGELRLNDTSHEVGEFSYCHVCPFLSACYLYPLLYLI